MITAPAALVPTPLGDFVQVSKGTKLLFGGDSMDGTRPRYIQIDDLRNDNDLKYAESPDGTEVVPSDLVIVWDGANSGEVAFGLTGLIGSTLARLRPIRPIHTPYLARFLQSQVRVIRDNTTGATIPHVSRQFLERLEVPIPFPDDPRRSLAEQKRIAAILDKADAIRRRRQEAARLADTLIPSVFYEMFGRTNAELQRWPMSPLGEFIVEGPQNGLYRPASEYGSGTRIVRIDSFYQGELCHLDQLKRLRLEDDTIQKWLLKRDDLLINRVNSTEFLGKSAIVPEHDEPMVFESNMMRFRVDTDRMVPRFLIAMLQTRLIKGQILKKERPAVNQSSINQDDVKGLKVPTPPIELQRDFAKRVPAMQRQRDAQPARAEAADTLFNSLVQRAFRGEL